jgi:hypothetical protein
MRLAVALIGVCWAGETKPPAPEKSSAQTFNEAKNNWPDSVAPRKALAA